MKKILIVLSMFASAASFAHTCHISLYDPYNRPYLNFYSYWDNNCQEAARKCYQAITDYRLHPDYYKCYTISMTEDTQSRPSIPVQVDPRAISNDDRDYRRELESGETVLYQSKQWLVVEGSDDGVYELMPVGGKKKDIEKNIDRKNISITRGCLRQVCTQTSVIYNKTQKEMAVEAISFNARYILKDIDTNQVMTDIEITDITK